MSVSSPSFIAILALVAGAWLAAAFWATPARLGARARRGGGGRRSSAGSPRCSRPARPCRCSSPPDGAIGGPDRLAGALGLDALAAALDGPVRRGRAVPGRRGGRARPPCSPTPRRAAASRCSCARRARRACFRVDGGPAPAGFAERAAVLWFIDVTEAEEAAAVLAAPARAPLGRARRSVRPDRGGALPDVASRPRPQARHGQRRLCRRGRGRGCGRRGPRRRSS